MGVGIDRLCITADRRREHPRRDPFPAIAAGERLTAAAGCVASSPLIPAFPRCPWFFYLALKQQLFPGGKRFPFFTAISVIGVALGVAAVLVVVTSVMGGFRYEIRHMIVDTQGDVQVKGQYGIAADYRPVMQRLEQQPGVTAATPFVTDFVMLEFQSKPLGTSLVGLDPASVERVIQLQHAI